MGYIHSFFSLKLGLFLTVMILTTILLNLLASAPKALLLFFLGTEEIMYL